MFDAGVLANSPTTALRAYDPGHDLPLLRRRFGADIAELGSNENPLGPSPLSLEAMRAALEVSFRYPDPRGAALKSALCRRLNLDPERIALGNGSHELLVLIAQCFADSAHSIVFAQYGFAVFALAAGASGAQTICVAALPRDHVDAPFGHDLEAMLVAVRNDTRIVYLANPNNPTGTWFDDASLARFMRGVPETVLVVVDEAYHEYVDAPGLSSAIGLIDEYPNLIVTRTFSKAYGLAGLRIGYLAAHASVVSVIERLRESFNVNSIALAGAEAALADVEHLEKVRAFNASERAWLVDRLEARGYKALPSQTNFVLLDLGRDAEALDRRLLAHGVVVRAMAGYGLAQTLRVGVGSRRENQRLLDALP
ncbi:MAG: histidinol-phosphate transaminase [Rhodanobacteraceae bacterium]